MGDKGAEMVVNKGKNNEKKTASLGQSGKRKKKKNGRKEERKLR